MPLPARYVDPLSDFGFKYLFHQEQHREIMISFLNAVFDGQKQIKHLEYGPSEYQGAHATTKRVFFDMVCTATDGTRFIIEMQRKTQKYFRDRCIFYLSRIISVQIPTGKSNWDTEMREVHLVGILEFNLSQNENTEALSDIHLADSNTKQAFFDRTGLKFLELPKFNKTEEELMTELDKWCFLFKNMHQLEERPKKLNSPAFKKIFDLAAIANLTTEQYNMYQDVNWAKWDYDNTIAYAKEEGEIKGKLEERIIMVTKMKQAGVPLPQIAEISSFSVEQIEQIELNQLNNEV